MRDSAKQGFGTQSPEETALPVYHSDRIAILKKGRAMKLQDFYPIIVTDKLTECRDFYVRWFGLEVGFESSWFIWMHSPEGQASIAFMHPNHPSSPPGPEPFSGKGMCLEFQVEDANAAYAEFQSAGANIGYALKDEPFGQRRFGLADPAGTWIDVIEQIEPAAGWWDKYMV